MALVIENLYKTFDGYVALDRINLSVDKAEFVCLLGPSGCGKTTLLRIIAGLLGADGGKIGEIATVTLRIPESETYLTQELMLPLYHCLCAMLEIHYFS